MNFHDAELLSAYLDGQLRPEEAARLESRIKAEAPLRELLDDLRQARDILRQAPHRRAPRNFTLKPTMRRLEAPVPRAVPAFRLAGVLASLLFVAALALNGLTPLAMRSMAAAPAPAYGVGGGAGGGMGGAAESTEAPLQALAAPSTPEAQAAPTPSAGQSDSATEAPPEAFAKQAPPAEAAAPAASPSAQPPVPLPWLIGFAAAGVIFAGAAWLLYRSSQRRFQEQWAKK